MARSGGRRRRTCSTSRWPERARRETELRLASYLDLAAHLRRRARDPKADCRELFARMVFNILIGNTDDHARNHALFWDGAAHELTPAYDLCPVLRAGSTASQAMTVGSEGRASTLRNALSRCSQFELDAREAGEIVEGLVAAARRHWPECAARAGLGRGVVERLARETVLGPGCFE